MEERSPSGAGPATRWSGTFIIWGTMTRYQTHTAPSLLNMRMITTNIMVHLPFHVGKNKATYLINGEIKNLLVTNKIL